MNLDLIYVAEMQSRNKEQLDEKYDAVDYFETYSESAIERNINRMNAKFYDSYENKIID